MVMDLSGECGLDLMTFVLYLASVLSGSSSANAGTGQWSIEWCPNFIEKAHKNKKHQKIAYAKHLLKQILADKD